MKKICLLFVSVLLVCTLCVLSLSACNGSSETEGGILSVDRLTIKDAYGNSVALRGTNFGCWLVQEGWMCALSNGTTTGDQTCELDTISTLYKRFGKTEAEKLVTAYRDNWITEADFQNVKTLGLNCVRIPFTYINLLNVFDNDGNVLQPQDMTWREDAFKYLDFAVENCTKYGLYAILDMHGAVGSQNGDHHSGDNLSASRLFNDDAFGEACRAKTSEIWSKVATRYNGNATVAAYDILNEPKGTNNNTEEVEWDYFDELYDAIRAVDAKHIIAMESCWEAGNLPKLDKYGWNNVIYEFHHYNWSSANQDNSGFYTYKEITLDNERECPALIGEFNCWGDNSRGDSTQTDMQAWAGVLEFYNAKGWHWTTWSYKVSGNPNSWGLYNEKVSDGKGALVSVDVSSMTKEQIATAWNAVGTSVSFEKYVELSDIVSEYANGTFFFDADKVSSATTSITND